MFKRYFIVLSMIWNPIVLSTSTICSQLNILPSRQVRVDYVQYEARRKLCSNYDIFLIDEKISSYLFPKLGKEFTKSRK